MHLYKNVVVIQFFVLSVYGQGKFPGVKSFEKYLQKTKLIFLRPLQGDIKCNEYLNVSVFTDFKPLPDEGLNLIQIVESGYALPDAFIGGNNSRSKRLSFNSRPNKNLNVNVFTGHNPLSDEYLDSVPRVESDYVRPDGVFRGYNSRPNEYLNVNVFTDRKPLSDEYLDSVPRVESGYVRTDAVIRSYYSRPNEYLNVNVFTDRKPLSDEYLDSIPRVESSYVRPDAVIRGHNSRPNEYLNVNVFTDRKPSSDEYLDSVRRVESGYVRPDAVLRRYNSRPNENLNDNVFTDRKPLSDEYLDSVRRVESGYINPDAVLRRYNSRLNEYLNDNILRNSRPLSGGFNSKPERLNFMAALGYGNNREKQYLCGGSLISPEFVITAAHCLFAGASGPVTYVRIGDLNLTSAEDDQWVQELEVKEFFAHPKYEYPKKYHDVALLRLNKPAVVSKHVYPICLEPQRRSIRYSTLYGAGWGALGYGEKRSGYLQVGELFQFLLKDCRQVYNTSYEIPKGIVDSLQICAGGLHKVVDTCVGDSGGPLFYVVNGVPRILGITSFGKECGTLGIPGVYTRVSNYVEWIESIVWPDNN